MSASETTSGIGQTVKMTEPGKPRKPSTEAEEHTEKWWSPNNISAIYLWIAMIIVFSLWSPDKFLHVQTLKDILNQNAIVGLAALVLAAPLACGALDLSIGAMMGLGGVTAAVLLAAGFPVWLAIVLAVTLCGIAGCLNGLVVIGLKVNALIATLATSLLFYAAQVGLSGNRIMTEGLSGGFLKLAQGIFAGITYPVFYFIALTLFLVYLLERSPIGRRVYASGYDALAAKLVGINVNRIKMVAFVASGSVAGFAGVVAASRVQAATPTNGMEYLFPAITAVFLGATQFRGGRFNPWGTMVSVLVIGTGEAGLIIAGAPSWSPDVFTAVLLIVAVGAASARRGGSEIVMSGV